MIGQIDTSGTQAKQWAHDEAESFQAHPGASVIQWPKPVRHGNRDWFQIQMEDTRQVHGTTIRYVQWYAQKAPGILIEVVLAGPVEEVQVEFKQIERVLAGIKLIEPPKPSGTFMWTSARVGTPSSANAPFDQNAILTEMAMAALAPPPQVPEPGAMASGYLLIQRGSKFFDRPPAVGDFVLSSEEMLYTARKLLDDGTSLFGGHVGIDRIYEIRLVTPLGEGTVNVTSEPAEAMFYEVSVTVK